MSSPSTSQVSEILEQLGFTALEAATYIALLESSPATAYQVAKRTGKPVANTYKAIASLSAKGAVVLDDGARQLCRAVDPPEFLDRLKARQQSLSATAARLLDGIGEAGRDNRVYQLEDVSAVYARAKAMLKRARDLVVIDAFPAPIARLKSELSATAKRKVRVTAQIYAPEKIPGVVTVPFSRAAELLAREPGQLMSLAVDRHELLLALISHDEQRVLQAVYTASSFIASILHAYISSEISICTALIDQNFAADFRRRATKTSRHVDSGPGALILIDPRTAPK